MDIQKTKTPFGTFVVRMDKKIVVGSDFEWSLEFTSDIQMKKGASLSIEVPAYQHQRSEEYLQAYDYWKPNYIYALGSRDDIKVDVRVESVESAFSHIKRWPDSKRVAIITCQEGLATGETISVYFGGTDRPWVGRECMTSRISQFANKVEGNYLTYQVAIDTQGTGDYVKLEVIDAVELLPDQPAVLKVFAPTSVQPDTRFEVELVCADQFNNPIFDYDMESIELRIIDEHGQEVQRLQCDNHKFKGSLRQEGRFLIEAISTDLFVEKAVIVSRMAARQLYWGDLHTHSNLSANIRDNDWNSTPDNSYLYSQKVSHLDFICLSEQTFRFNEDRSVNIDQSTWEQIGQKADMYNTQALVTFPGIELHSKRGDTIAVFGERLSTYGYPGADIEEVTDLWEKYKDKKMLTIPHFHRYCEGRPSKDQQEKKYEGFNLDNWKESNPKEVLCEIFSSQWGRFENQEHPMVLKARNNVKHNTFCEFLNMGKRWGVTAGSDGHDGKPGYGGLTGVFAADKTREDIFDGLTHQRTLATTHPRWFGEISLEQERLIFKGIAPHVVSKIEIIRDGQLLHSVPNADEWFELVLDIDPKADAYYYGRIVMDNRHIGWTSPIWTGDK